MKRFSSPKDNSCFSSPTTEVTSKELFKIASDSIIEVIKNSGDLSPKGLCEAIMFNSNIILNDPILKTASYYEAVFDDHLILLYFFIKEQKTDLKEDRLINFINERMEFYFSEYNKLVNEKQYTPIWVYSAFYLAPLKNGLKPCLDIFQVMNFQIGLIRMAVKVQELLDDKIKLKNLQTNEKRGECTKRNKEVTLYTEDYDYLLYNILPNSSTVILNSISKQTSLDRFQAEIILNRWKYFHLVDYIPCEDKWVQTMPTQTLIVEEFKELMDISILRIKKDLKTNELYFTYGVNKRGIVMNNKLPEHPLLSQIICSNSQSFWILHEEGVFPPVPIIYDF